MNKCTFGFHKWEKWRDATFTFYNSFTGKERFEEGQVRVCLVCHKRVVRAIK
jgi:hypothetical protein